MKTYPVLAAAAAVFAGSAVAAGVQQISFADSEFLSKYEPAGETVECLSARTIDKIKPLTETSFLVKAGPDYYLSATSSACAGATHWNSRVEYVKPGTRICSGQIIRIVDNQSGMLRGTCSLGTFEKMRRKAPKSDAPA